jgi:hypothetical protein
MAAPKALQLQQRRLLLQGIALRDGLMTDS